jgi:hypothetical protein
MDIGPPVNELIGDNGHHPVKNVNEGDKGRMNGKEHV